MNSDNKAFNKYGIAKIYSFDERQSDYYANAGVYLGLIQRYKKGSIYNYKLSNLGKQIFKLPLRSRHLRVAELILSHSPFRQTLKSYIDNANIPSKEGGNRSHEALRTFTRISKIYIIAVPVQ